MMSIAIIIDIAMSVGILICWAIVGSVGVMIVAPKKRSAIAILSNILAIASVPMPVPVFITPVFLRRYTYPISPVLAGMMLVSATWVHVIENTCLMGNDFCMSIHVRMLLRY